MFKIFFLLCFSSQSALFASDEVFEIAAPKILLGGVGSCFEPYRKPKPQVPPLDFRTLKRCPGMILPPLTGPKPNPMETLYPHHKYRVGFLKLVDHADQYDNTEFFLFLKALTNFGDQTPVYGLQMIYGKVFPYRGDYYIQQPGLIHLDHRTLTTDFLRSLEGDVYPEWIKAVRDQRTRDDLRLKIILSNIKKAYGGDPLSASFKMTSQLPPL